MSDEFKMKKAEVYETNSLHKKPDEMKRWIQHTPQEIKKQLTEKGDLFTTLSSYAYSATQKHVDPESEMNPANYASFMIAKLLKDYRNPENKAKMEEAGIDDKFIKTLIQEVGYSNLDNSYNPIATHGVIAAALKNQIHEVENYFEKEKIRENNLKTAATISEELGKTAEKRWTCGYAKPLVEIEEIANKYGITPREIGEHIDRAVSGKDFKPYQNKPDELNKAFKELYSCGKDQLNAMDYFNRERKFNATFKETMDNYNSGLDSYRDELLQKLKHLGISPDEAKRALYAQKDKEREAMIAAEKQKEINEKAVIEAKEKQAQAEKKAEQERSAAVQIGDLIVIYDPNNKNEEGRYNNFRYYARNDDGSLRSASLDEACKLAKTPIPYKHEAIKTGEKIDNIALLKSQINKGAER